MPIASRATPPPTPQAAVPEPQPPAPLPPTPAPDPTPPSPAPDAPIPARLTHRSRTRSHRVRTPIRRRRCRDRTCPRRGRSSRRASNWSTHERTVQPRAHGLTRRRADLHSLAGDNRSSGLVAGRANEGVRDDYGEGTLGGTALAEPGSGLDAHSAGDAGGAAGRCALPRGDSLARASGDRDLARRRHRVATDGGLPSSGAPTRPPSARRRARLARPHLGRVDTHANIRSYDGSWPLPPTSRAGRRDRAPRTGHGDWHRQGHRPRAQANRAAPGARSRRTGCRRGRRLRPVGLSLAGALAR